MLKPYALINTSKRIFQLRDACTSPLMDRWSLHILLIGNDMEILDSMKGYLNKSFSKQDLGEATYTLSIKIYIDRSRRLIRFFNEYIP